MGMKLIKGGTVVTATEMMQADVLIDLGDYDRAAEIAEGIGERTYTKLLKGRIALEQGNAQAAEIRALFLG